MKPILSISLVFVSPFSIPAFSQSGWIKTPGIIEVKGGWLLNNKEQLKAHKQQCIDAAELRARQNLVKYYYNPSTTPYKSWIICDDTKSLLTSQQQTIVNAICMLETKVVDLGFKHQKNPKNSSKSFSTVWEVEVRQNLKILEMASTSRLASNTKLLEILFKTKAEKFSQQDIVNAKKVTGEMAVDLVIIDVLINSKPYFTTSRGQEKFKPGFMNYTPPKGTPVACINALGILDEFFVKYVPEIPLWKSFSSKFFYSQKSNSIAVVVEQE